QTAVPTGDFLSGAGGEHQLVLFAADGDGSASFLIHALIPPYSAFQRGVIRLVHFIVPAGDGGGLYAGVPLGDLSLPGVLTLTVYLVAAHDCSLDSRRGEFNTLALGG